MPAVCIVTASGNRRVPGAVVMTLLVLVLGGRAHGDLRLLFFGMC